MGKRVFSFGVGVGSSVVLTEDYVSLFGCVEARQVIHQVVDARRGNGEVAYMIAPVCASLPGGVDRARAREVFADDLREVAS